MFNKSVEDHLYKLIGNKIRTYRKSKHKMTQTELADIAQVKRTTITNIECGSQKIPLHVLYKIAIALDTPIESLLPNAEHFVKRKVTPIKEVEIGTKKRIVKAELATIVDKLKNEIQ